MSGYDGMSLAEKMLDALQKEGAEKASAQITKQIKSEMNIDSGKLSLYRTTENISFSLLSLIDGKKGVAAGNDTGESAIKETARQAAALSQSSEKDEANDISPQQPAAELAIGDEEPDNEKMYARLTEFLDYTKSAYPTLQLNQCILDFNRSDTVFANSNKVGFHKQAGVYSFQAMFFAKDEHGAGSFNYSGAAHLDLNMPLKNWGGLDELMRLSCGETRTQPLSGSFTGEIILSPAAASDFIDMLTGLFLSELPALFTADGFKAENTTLIEKGVVKDFTLGLYGAKKTGRARCVSGGGGLTVEKGAVPKDELIKKVKRGILLGRFSGGRPAVNGDFSGVAKNSYLIEDGRIVQPLSETMIAGNLVALFNELKAVSKDAVNYGYSESPWIYTSGVTISGR